VSGFRVGVLDQIFNLSLLTDDSDARELLQRRRNWRRLASTRSKERRILR
jgi:hypothetical protein